MLLEELQHLATVHEIGIRCNFKNLRCCIQDPDSDLQDLSLVRWSQCFPGDGLAIEKNGFY
jgi:hypothetical protein